MMKDDLQVPMLVIRTCFNSSSSSGTAADGEQLMTPQALCMLTSCCRALRNRLLQQDRGTLCLDLTIYADDIGNASSFAAWLTTVGRMFGSMRIDASTAATFRLSGDMIAGGRAIGEALKSLHDAGTLRQLVLTCLPLQAGVLARLHDSLQHLELVDVWGLAATSPGQGSSSSRTITSLQHDVACLTRLTRLQLLNDYGDGSAGDMSGAVSGLLQLQHLVMRGGIEDDPDLRPLVQLTFLEFGSGWGETAATMSSHKLSPMAPLQHLDLFAAAGSITPAAVVSKLTALTYLGCVFDLRRDGNAADIKSTLSCLPHLQALKVRALPGILRGYDDCMSAAVVLGAVVDAPRQLEFLHMRDVSLMDDADAHAVASLSQLTTLELAVRAAGSNCLQQIFEAPGALPKLDTVVLNSPELGYAMSSTSVMRALCMPGQLPSLKRVYLICMGDKFSLLRCAMAVMKPEVVVDYAYKCEQCTWA